VSQAVTVVSGVGLLEGPVWRPGAGDLTVTVVGAGKIMRVDVAAGTVEEVADTAGGPNGAYPAADGGLLVTQNGGLDWDAIGIPNPNPSRPTTPGVQHVGMSGDVRLLTGADGPFRAPNDLCVSADGTIWFTDPPQFPPPTAPVGRVWRWRPGGRPEVYAGGLKYCNGIAVDTSGDVLVVEQAGLMRLRPDGTRDWLIETLPSGGDGFKFDTEGNIYVCGGRHVTVVSPDGRVLEQLEAPAGDAMMTNCCFGGEDLRTLFATDGGSGRVLAWASMPVPGVPLQPVAVP